MEDQERIESHEQVCCKSKVVEDDNVTTHVNDSHCHNQRLVSTSYINKDRVLNDIRPINVVRTLDIGRFVLFNLFKIFIIEVLSTKIKDF